MAACPPHAPEQISRPGYDAVTLGRCAIVNRIQALVLSFFLVVWVSLVAILVAAPEVYDQALRLPPGRHRPVEIAFLTALFAFIALLSIGMLRRWRWTFWLIQECNGPQRPRPVTRIAGQPTRTVDTRQCLRRRAGV